MLMTRGYHGTRVDDVTEKAGVSHGAFYRYFDNKDELVTTVAIRALFNIRGAFTKIPTITNDADRRSTDDALQSWLENYVTTYASEAALVRVWVDATSDDPTLGVESAGAARVGSIPPRELPRPPRLRRHRRRCAAHDRAARGPHRGPVATRAPSPGA